jgi:hypothetical protein
LRFRRQLVIALVVLLLATLVGCKQKPATNPQTPAPATREVDTPGEWFADVTEKSGLHFIHETGPVGNYRLPEIMGSGAALFDYDNDGRLDIYLIQNGGPRGAKNQLFRQQPDGTFADVSEGSGLDVAGYGMGVAVGDVNNDGFPDVLICEFGGVRLFLNNGNGTFTEVTREAGLGEPPETSPIRPWPMTATFFDYDRDGKLDLAVVSYVAYDPSRKCADAQGRQDYCGPGDFPGSITRIFHNTGWDDATHIPHFQDVTASAGLAEAPSPGLGTVAADFDGDGWPDLLIANDGRPNRLWINQHDGTFKDQAAERGLAFSTGGQVEAGMGIALGDTSMSGLFDVYITHLTDENNRLWMQSPRGTFTDRTIAAGLIGHGQGTGFGTVLADFDCAGALDLAVVNGRVLRSPHPISTTAPSSGNRGTRQPPVSSSADLAPYWQAYAERNQLFAGDGHGHFRDIAAANPAFCAAPGVARGLAAGDIFNDGAVSLLETTVAGPAHLYRNIARRKGHWLMVRAIDPALGGRDAYGAKITVQTSTARFIGLVNPGSSYLCSNDPRVHFGLGPADHIASIEVRWPDGTRETFPGGKADQLRVIRKGEGRLDSGK